MLAELNTPTQGVYSDGNSLNDFDEDGQASLSAELLEFGSQNFQLFGLTALEKLMLPLELAQAPHHR